MILHISDEIEKKLRDQPTSQMPMKNEFTRNSQRGCKHHGKQERH
jgi:hypothetical protein